MSSKKRQKIDEVIFKTQGFETTAIDQTTQNTSSESAAPEAVLGANAAYTRVLQGKGVNGFIASSIRRHNYQLNLINHTATTESEGVTISIDEDVIESLGAQTFKTFMITLMIATTQLPRGNNITAEAIVKGRTVQIPLAKYMEACKLKDIKEARAQLNDTINTIYGVSLEWDEAYYIKPEGKSRKVKETRHHSMRILDHAITPKGKYVRRGVAEIKLSYDMAEYLSGAYIMPFSAALLSINTRYNPYSIPLGWKLYTLYNMNFGKKRQNTTTVKTLLDAAKEIPRYSEIAATGQIYDRIIKPFDRDLAELVNKGILSVYWYFDDKDNRIEGGTYTDGKYNESSRLGLISYTEFSALNIYYELKDYPDQTPRLEDKSKRIKAAISRNRNAAKKRAESKAEQSSDKS